jgi:DNA-binding transcriptional LysR family regulator
VALVPAARANELPAHRLTVETLARQPLVTTPLGTSTRRQVEEAFAAAGLVANVAVETDHHESIAALVRAGARVALLPRRLAEDSASDDVVLRDITPRLQRDVGIVHRSGALSPSAASFLAIALERGLRPGRPPPRRR